MTLLARLTCCFLTCQAACWQARRLQQADACICVCIYIAAVYPKVGLAWCSDQACQERSSGCTACHVSTCRDVAISDKNWRILLLRYFNPVGAHPSGESATSNRRTQQPDAIRAPGTSSWQLAAATLNAGSSAHPAFHQQQQHQQGTGCSAEPGRHASPSCQLCRLSRAVRQCRNTSQQATRSQRAVSFSVMM